MVGVVGAIICAFKAFKRKYLDEPKEIIGDEKEIIGKAKENIEDDLAYAV
jgi:hypothetical protein